MVLENRKQIILQSLVGLLEERNLSKVTTALLAEKSDISEAALYKHFPSKRSIYMELFSFCDETISSKCAEYKKNKSFDRNDAKNLFMFCILFIEKNQGFARLLSREALSANEQNVVDATNQFYERLELNFKQLLNKNAKDLVTQPGVSAQLIVTTFEGTISRYIRSKFKEKPSQYIENIWILLENTLFK